MSDHKESKGGGRLQGRSARLADLVQYQEASVVSHQILHGDAGSVTLFAFDEGEGLSEHTTPFDALVQLVDGEAEITIAGQSQRLKEGDVVVMPADKPHAVQALTRFKMLLTMIKA